MTWEGTLGDRFADEIELLAMFGEAGPFRGLAPRQHHDHEGGDMESLPSGPGPLQELHPKAGNARKILIEGDDGQISLQGGRRNERVHIANQAWAMGRTHGAPNVRIALHDRIGQKIGIDFPKKSLELLPAPGEIRQALEVFNHFRIHQHTSGGLVLPDEGCNQIHKGRSAMQIAGKRGTIQEVLSHTASGGVGWDS